MKKIIALALLVAAVLMMVGCEGKEGPVGATGPQGPQGPAGANGQNGRDGSNAVIYSFVGNSTRTCGSCHSSTKAEWMTTGHFKAYDSLSAADKMKPYCLNCHTTGFDATVSFSDTLITAHGPNMSGFDDYWPPANATDSMRVTALKNVQCEACHGPGGEFHQPNVSLTSSKVNGEFTSLCVKCHQSQLTEWEESGHGGAIATAGGQAEFTAEFVRATWSTSPIGSLNNCWECHTSEGFIKANDADWTSLPQPALADQVGCATCHDPHKGSPSNLAQLRNLTNDSSTFRNGENPPRLTFTGYGNAQACVQCHKDRRDSANIVGNGTSTGQIYAGNTRFGPHESPQMDMFLGGGCFEIPSMTYNRGSSSVGHKAISNACIRCHMVLTSEGGGQHHDHKFEVTAAACVTCHTGTTNFDINGHRTSVDNKLTQIWNWISSRRPGIVADSLGSPRWTNANERKVTYAYKFVMADGSHGAHNPTYVNSILDNAIAYMATVPAP